MVFYIFKHYFILFNIVCQQYFEFILKKSSEADMFDGDEKEGKLVGQVDTFIAAILARRGTFDLFCTSFSHIINEHKIATAQLKICHKRTM